MSECSPVFFYIWRKLQGACYNYRKRKQLSLPAPSANIGHDLFYHIKEKKRNELPTLFVGSVNNKLKVSCTLCILQPSLTFRGASVVVANPKSWPDSWKQVELGLRTQKFFLEAVLSFRAPCCALLYYPAPQKELTRKLRLLWLQVFPLWWRSCKKYRTSHIMQLCV